MSQNSYHLILFNIRISVLTIYSHFNDHATLVVISKGGGIALIPEFKSSHPTKYVV